MPANVVARAPPLGTAAPIKKMYVKYCFKCGIALDWIQVRRCRLQNIADGAGADDLGNAPGYMLLEALCVPMRTIAAT